MSDLGSEELEEERENDLGVSGLWWGRGVGDPAAPLLAQVSLADPALPCCVTQVTSWKLPEC